jgi:DNA-binding MarR family transcriptional regulator
MAAGGASLARTKLLIFLERQGPARAADIAEYLALAPRTVTEGIDALERAGLVRRDPHENDRRVKWISITAAGRKAITETEPLRRRLVEEIYGALSKDERDALGKILAKLSSAVDGLEAAEVERRPKGGFKQVDSADDSEITENEADQSTRD